MGVMARVSVSVSVSVRVSASVSARVRVRVRTGVKGTPWHISHTAWAMEEYIYHP